MHIFKKMYNHSEQWKQLHFDNATIQTLCKPETLLVIPDLLMLRYVLVFKTNGARLGRFVKQKGQDHEVWQLPLDKPEFVHIELFTK